MSSTETVVLLLPDAPDVAEISKHTLLNLKGVMGVAVHSFEGHGSSSSSSKPRSSGLKWYASVTFDSLRVTQEHIKKSVQDACKSKVIDVNKGKVKTAMESGGGKGGEEDADEGKTE